jgi:hypothetical protein
MERVKARRIVVGCAAASVSTWRERSSYDWFSIVPFLDRSVNFIIVAIFLWQR